MYLNCSCLGTGKTYLGVKIAELLLHNRSVWCPQTEENSPIPVLKEILAINRNIKLLGSPWSPSTWMKTNQHTVSGSLMPEYYDACDYCSK